QRVRSGDPGSRVAEVPHWLVACGVCVDRAARDVVPLYADARALALIVRNVGKRSGEFEEVHVGLRTRYAVLIGPCIDATDSELIYEVGVNRPTVRHLPVGGVLNEHTVACVDD